jgi:hypothetical protein
MGKWIINIILGALITLAILILVQWTFNFYTGVWVV